MSSSRWPASCASGRRGWGDCLGDSAACLPAPPAVSWAREEAAMRRMILVSLIAQQLAGVGCARYDPRPWKIVGGGCDGLARHDVGEATGINDQYVPIYLLISIIDRNHLECFPIIGPTGAAVMVRRQDRPAGSKRAESLPLRMRSVRDEIGKVRPSLCALQHMPMHRPSSGEAHPALKFTGPA